MVGAAGKAQSRFTRREKRMGWRGQAHRRGLGTLMLMDIGLSFSLILKDRDITFPSRSRPKTSLIDLWS